MHNFKPNQQTVVVGLELVDGAHLVTAPHCDWHHEGRC
jgi:hypothetical protein